MSSALRHEALPLQYLLERTFKVLVPIRIHEDNSACKIAYEKGYSPQMRYLPKVQRCSIGVIHDIVSDPELRTKIVQQPTDTQKGDIFTKELTPQAFWKACEQIGYKQIVRPKL